MKDGKKNIREGNSFSDAYILSEIVKALSKTIAIVSQETKQKAGTMYRITVGENKLSSRMINVLMDRYPNINYLFITKGEGEPLRENERLTLQNNVLGKHNLPDIDFQKEIFANLTLINKKIMYLQQDLAEIKARLKEK